MGCTSSVHPGMTEEQKKALAAQVISPLDPPPT